MLFRFALVLLFPLSFSAATEPAGLDALTRPQVYASQRASSSHEDLNRNGDAWPIEAGETVVLADVEGPGIVTHFWNTVGAVDPFYGRTLILRIYYDGNEAPSVQAPLGDFFGVGHGAYAEFSSATVTVSSHGRSRTCYWPMPFQKRFRMTITNDSPTEKVNSFYFYLNWQKHEQLPEDTHYFHAEYRQDMPAQPGNYVIADIQGRGHYVGTVQSVHQVELGWFGEGDDFFYIDGAEYPQLRGTGTEDYFNDAWGFRPFSTPYHGVSLYEGVFAGDRLTAYRWHIPDPVPFKESLRLEIEHKGSVYTEQGQSLAGFVERPDWVSSVAFWYQDAPAKLKTAVPPVDQRVAPYRILKPAELPWTADPPQVIIPALDGLTYLPGQQNAAIEFKFSLEERGRYQVSGLFDFSIMAGVYQPLMNGAKFGPPVDFRIINADTLWRTLDLIDLEAGEHVLRFEGVDQPSAVNRTMAPPHHAFGLKRLILLRLEDMKGYGELLHELTKP